MKSVNSFILEKLRLGKDTFSQEARERKAFKTYYKGLPEKICEEILDEYVYGKPFDEYFKDDINEKIICTPFELLFLMAVMLIDDGLSSKYFTYLGTKWYKMHLHGQNNPYDSCWFEEDITNDMDTLDMCKEWIKNNRAEFNNIYDICYKYKDIINISTIEGFYENVFETYEKDF